MNDLGYVAISFSISEKEYFSSLVKKLCSSNDFYKSDVVSYINGDVTNSMHLTLFYGFLSKKIDKDEIQKMLNLFTQKFIFVTKLSVRFGFQNLYKIIELKVKDNEFKLLDYIKIMKKFPYDQSVQLAFDPHITLAYVKPSYKDIEIVINKKIKIQSINYYLS